MEVVQHDDYSITITAKDNTEKIRPINIGDNRKLTDKCTTGEITALRSVTASLAWIARQVRPGLSYRVSKLQCVAGKSTIKDLRQCNKVLEYALETSEQGFYYASDGINWKDAVVCAIADASFGNEFDEVADDMEPGRSQQG